jgi:hypothetical protein
MSIGAVYTLECCVALVVLCDWQEIDREGLVVREDKALHADVGLREVMVSLLLSYDPQWLRLGLETVLGVDLAPRTGKSAEQALKRVILEVGCARGKGILERASVLCAVLCGPVEGVGRWAGFWS